jgi:transposase
MRITTLEDREIIRILAQAGHTAPDTAQRLGWKVPTVRKWRRREQQEGQAGLVSKMGRPATGALSTFPPVLVATLQALRQTHPGWGPLTLYTELAQDLLLTGQKLPERSSIARWLAQKGLTRPYERHQALPQATPASAQAAHEEWEMDARGYAKVPGIGVVNLINLNDRFSRVKLLSYPCWLGEQRASRHPDTADYQLVFRLAASEWGLPDRLYVDRDSVFYDNTSKSPFPLQLHLWLLALEVELVIGPPNRPTVRGITERSHQTWDQQVLQGQGFAAWEVLYDTLRRRRDFLNEQLPCSTLGGVPPLVAHPEARWPRRLYRPEWEAEMINLSRVYTYLSQGRWFRKGSNVGTVCLGSQVYVLGKAWARKEVQITFDPADQHLVFYAPDGKMNKRLPIKGISVAELMGELGPLVHLHQFQLALPFTWKEWRVIQLCETLGDTT